MNRILKTPAIHDPTSFMVIDLTDDSDHGLYPSLSEARGCVEFDRLTEWQIWRGGVLVESREAWMTETD